MKAYIAAPLFNEMEKARNSALRDFLKSNGFETYLPQEDGGIAFELLKESGDARKVRSQIFENDVRRIKECDAIVCILDGRVPDEGLCVELGIAFALGKRCLGYKTDQRTLDKYGDNLMIDGCIETIAHSKEELLRSLMREQDALT